jgi:hypothetical protein
LKVRAIWQVEDNFAVAIAAVRLKDVQEVMPINEFLTRPFFREPMRMIAAVAPNLAIDERDQVFDPRGVQCERHLCASNQHGGTCRGALQIPVASHAVSRF